MLETQDLKDFSIHSWYHIFKNETLRSILIEISEELLEHFQSCRCGGDIEEICTKEYVTTLKNALNVLNRDAFVKNNWHAPIDARAFSLGNTLKVTNLDDLMVMLTASDVVLKDFANTKTNCPFYIVLKPFTSIHPASEFRCIVVNNVLRGITPRDWPTYYAHFAEEGPKIVEIISCFFNQKIKGKFPKNHYTFDIYLTYLENPVILDFGPLNNKTNLYAFTWKEIQPIIQKESAEEVAPVFRYLESDIGIMTKSEALFKFSQAE